MDSHNLSKLRKLIAENNIGYYLVLTQDAHNSEYVSPCDKRREHISQFTGSAGTAIIGRDKYVELATDGRYWIQAEAQLGSSWALRKEGMAGVVGWVNAISSRAKAENVAIGVDPKLISYQQAKQIIDSGAELRAIEKNLVDQVWKHKPEEPANEIFELSTQFSGQSTPSKIADLRAKVKKMGADAIVLSALDQIAWLLNLRGSDIDYNPVFKSYLVLTFDECVLYVSPQHSLPPKDHLEGITVKNYDAVFDDVKTLSFTMEKKVWVASNSSWAMVKAAGDRAILDPYSPVEEAKAVKNAVEISNAQKAQLNCGTSVLRLLSWLKKSMDDGQPVTEYEASQKLQEFRMLLPGFKGPSFETISSSGPNAAVIHYAPSPEGSRTLRPNEVYLCDSGSQFELGTTDTTRTAWFGKMNPPDELKEAYTLVLKGHIALATAVFREGSTGYMLDPLARQPMQKYGYDYNHGTGHGVGSYLNVHEGPMYIGMNAARASAPLEVGNIISNEPGIYKEGCFGIRIESLMVVEPTRTKYQMGTKFLHFRTMTLVPLDLNLIEVELLERDEIAWINRYHARCRKELEPMVSGHDREYLHFHTTPIQI